MSEQALNVIWSWLRVYLAAALTYLLAALVNGDPVAWNAIAIAGAVAVLPVVINWLNPADPRYGKGYEG
jgi:hypothetical protein